MVAAVRAVIIPLFLVPTMLAAQAAKLDRRAPDFALSAVGGAGSKIRLLDFHGKPVVISFWATWCPPCRKEMPEIASLFRANQGTGLVVLAVNEEALETDINGKPVYRRKAEHDSALSRFLREVALPFPVLTDDRDGAVWNRYSAGKLYLPATFVVDSGGVVRAMFNGAVPIDSLAKAVRMFVPISHQE